MLFDLSLECLQAYGRRVRYVLIEWLAYYKIEWMWVVWSDHCLSNIVNVSMVVWIKVIVGKCCMESWSIEVLDEKIKWIVCWSDLRRLSKFCDFSFDKSVPWGQGTR